MPAGLICRKCGEPHVWDRSHKRWRECRNGCSPYTAMLPDGTERVYAAGSDDKGRPVRGDAIHRRATCDD